MTKREQNAEAGRKFGAAVNAAGIIERFFGYLVSYAVLVVILALLVGMTGNDHNAFARGLKEYGTLVMLFVFVVPALLMFLWERGVRKFRREHGLSIYKNVKKELEQIEFNEAYEQERDREERARAAYETKKKTLG